MSSERLDDETLAAYIDGALSPDERRQVLDELANDPDAIRRVAAAIRTSRKNEETAAEPLVHLALVPDVPVGHRVQSPWRGIRTTAIVLAACVTMVIGVRSLIDPPSPPPDVAAWLPDADPVLLASATATAAHPGWGNVRSVVETLGEEALAVRLGVRSADLWDAATRGAWGGAMAMADSLEILARRLEGGDVIAEEIREQVQGRNASAGDYTRLLQRLANRTHAGDWYEAGRWIEVARLTADRGDAHFLPAISRAVAAAQPLARVGAGTTSISERLKAITVDYRNPALKASTGQRLTELLEEMAH